MVKDSFMHVTFKRFRNDSMKKDLEITHTFCALFSVETIKDQKYNKKKKNSIERTIRTSYSSSKTKNYIYYRNILNFFFLTNIKAQKLIFYNKNLFH